MAKRFSSTQIWDEDWFLEMPAEYKLFWFYMLCACDHAGLFRVNVKKFCGLNDLKMTSSKALDLFNNGKQRVRVVSESVWLIEDFFFFQYGSIFNPNNKVHASIEHAYNHHNIKMTSIRGLKDLKERVKDKEIKKGGVGENKNGKKIQGERFDDDMTSVLFEDGTSQELGESQKMMADNHTLNPKAVIKGYAY